MIPRHAPRKTEALRRLMVFEAADCDVPASRWYTQYELAAVGGMRFSARLFDLVRKDKTLAYDCRPVDEENGRFVYRLRQRREGEACPQTRRRKQSELEAENAVLRAEVASLRRVWARLSGEELELLVSARPVHMEAP